MTIEDIFHVDIKGRTLKIVVFDTYCRIVKLYYNYNDFYKSILKNKTMQGIDIDTFKPMDMNRLFYSSTERWAYIQSFDEAKVKLAIREYKHLKDEYIKKHKTELLDMHTQKLRAKLNNYKVKYPEYFI